MNKKAQDEQRMIQQIMDNFDWQKCHTTMSAIGWEWFFVGVPTIHDLRECGRKLIDTAIQGVKNPKSNTIHIITVQLEDLKLFLGKTNMVTLLKLNWSLF